MADISLTTASRVEVVEMIEGLTLVASEAITAGAPITIIPSSTGAGQWANSDANSGTASLKTIAAIATHTVAAGQALTGMKRGVLEGFDFSGQAYFLPIYVSDTVGRLADAAGTTNLSVGRVIPGTAHPPITSSPDKLLYVDISYLIDIDTDT